METLDDKTKERCIAARLRESDIHNFESMRDRETKEMNPSKPSLSKRVFEKALQLR